MMSIGYNVKDLIDAGLVLTDSSGVPIRDYEID